MRARYVQGMARSKQAQLDALDARIARLEAIDVTDWSKGDERHHYAELRELYAERRALELEVSQDATGAFSLIEPQTE